MAGVGWVAVLAARGSRRRLEDAVRQARLKRLIHNAPVFGEVGFATRHEVFERQFFRHAAPLCFKDDDAR